MNRKALQIGGLAAGAAGVGGAATYGLGHRSGKKKGFRQGLKDTGLGRKIMYNRELDRRMHAARQGGHTPVVARRYISRSPTAGGTTFDTRRLAMSMIDPKPKVMPVRNRRPKTAAAARLSRRAAAIAGGAGLAAGGVGGAMYGSHRGRKRGYQRADTMNKVLNPQAWYALRKPGTRTIVMHRQTKPVYKPGTKDEVALATLPPRKKAASLIVGALDV